MHNLDFWINAARNDTVVGFYLLTSLLGVLLVIMDTVLVVARFTHRRSSSPHTWNVSFLETGISFSYFGVTGAWLVATKGFSLYLSFFVALCTAVVAVGSTASLLAAVRKR